MESWREIRPYKLARTEAGHFARLSALVGFALSEVQAEDCDLAARKHTAMGFF